MPVDVEAVTDAVLARLVDESPGFLVGDAETPPNVPVTAQGMPVNWYGILYPVNPATSEGALGEAVQMIYLQYQVTVIGGTRAQAQHGQAEVVARLDGWTPTVSGIGFEPMQLFDPTGVERDGDVVPPRFFSADRFVVFAN